MERQKLKTIFITALEDERTLRGLSQWEMSEKLTMSVSGYRKMVSGATEAISIYTAHAAAETLCVPISLLLEERDGRLSELQRMLYETPDDLLEKISRYLSVELRIRREQPQSDEGTTIDVLTLTGYTDDGMIYDSMNVEKLKLKNTYGARIGKGFRIGSDALLPVYATNDILLLEERAARDGDTVVAMNVPGRRVYIRRVASRGTRRELYPVHGRGSVIVIGDEEKKNWFDIGCVVTSINEPRQ